VEARFVTRVYAIRDDDAGEVARLSGDRRGQYAAIRIDARNEERVHLHRVQCYSQVRSQKAVVAFLAVHDPVALRITNPWHEFASRQAGQIVAQDIAPANTGIGDRPLVWICTYLLGVAVAGDYVHHRYFQDASGI